MDVIVYQDVSVYSNPTFVEIRNITIDGVIFEYGLLHDDNDVILVYHLESDKRHGKRVWVLDPFRYTELSAKYYNENFK